MNKNKHLLLWSSLGVLALLVAAAVQENFLKDWRQIQASARADGGPIDVRLRQIVVPKLKVTDRCVSCHVGMVPGEQGLSGSPLAAAHSRLVHDPGEFGCTVCHGPSAAAWCVARCFAYQSGSRPAAPICDKSGPSIPLAPSGRSVPPRPSMR